MNITLGYVGSEAASKEPFRQLAQHYLDRCSQFAACAQQNFRDEKSFLEWKRRQTGRTPILAVLLDSRGKTLSSEAFAKWLGTQRDGGAQNIAFVIGPASGWSGEAREGAGLLLSLGPMTLAHALARVVIAEQIYRAVTILTGHPYHSGH